MKQAATLERPPVSDLDVPHEDDSCEAVKGLCGTHPVVAVAYWNESCACGVNPQRICREHRDQIRRDSARALGQFRCGWCGAKLILVRLEAL